MRVARVVAKQCSRPPFSANALPKQLHWLLLEWRIHTERTVDITNFLPSSVNFSTLNAFKRSIVSTDFSLFLKCVAE